MEIGIAEEQKGTPGSFSARLRQERIVPFESLEDILRWYVPYSEGDEIEEETKSVSRK